MNRPICLIALLSIGLCCPAGSSRAAEPAGTGTAGTSDAELQKLLTAMQPTWTASASLEGGFGYKDNLLLSHSNPEHSAFARANLETLLWHVPRGRIDYFGFVNAQGTRYFNGLTVDHEEEAFAGLEWRFRVPELLTFSMDAQAYYLDQIFDVSDTEIQRVVAELQVAGAKVGPTLRWSVRPWLWIEARGGGNRESFRDGLNNATITDGAARIGWEPSDRVEVSVGASQRRRRFDRRYLFSASGLPEDGLLVVHEREWGGQAAVTWGRSRHWKTTVRAGRVHYQDNGSGYLNYMRNRVGAEVEWSAGAWLVRTEGEAGRKNYELQTVGRGVSPPKQLKDEFDASVRVERKLSDHWTLLAQYRWERSRSNDVIASYKVNEGLLGARWSWEK